MANEPKVNLAFVETLPENPVKGTVYMSPDSAEGFLKVGVGDNETETIFDSNTYAKKTDSVWVRGEGANSAVLKNTDSSAAGAGAVAHGDNVHASGDYSHAEGKDSSASGEGSHAEGNAVTASGESSHAEGFRTDASGNYSHAEGRQTSASGEYSHAEGSDTTAIGFCSHAEGFGGSESLSFTISGNANDTSYITDVMHSLKRYDILEYNGIIAVVTRVNATKKFTVDHTLSDVQLTNASGLKKIRGISYGEHSHAEGYGAKATGDYSHAEGGGTTAFGEYSHAEGTTTSASASGSHAEGQNTSASGSYSHAEGNSTTASNSYSHAEGTSTTASGAYSHAEGTSTTASGSYSHAEGNSTTASALSSHAEGRQTSASGQYSHAEGTSTTASGAYSHAEGYHTTATNNYEHAQGNMNISHDNTMFSIGNGYYDDSDQEIRSNALEIMQNGDAYLYGVASFNGKNIGNNKTLQYFLNLNPISSSEYDYIFGILSPVPVNLLSSHLIIDRIPEDALQDIEGLYGSLSNYIDSIVTDTDNEVLYPGGEAGGPGPSNRWEWTGNTMSIDGNDYYVWYCIYDGGFQQPIYGLMPLDMTLETCISNSMHSDISNRWSPLEYIIRGDTTQDYEDLPVRYTLIYVKEYEYDTHTIGNFDLLDATLYLDTFDDKARNYMGDIYEEAGAVNIGEYIDYYCENNLNDGASTECTYQEDITFDGETYHMWYCDNYGGGYEFYGLMPLSVTAEEVANNSKYVNPFNLYCPFTYELGNDDEVYSDDPDYLKTKRCLVTVVPGE